MVMVRSQPRGRLFPTNHALVFLLCSLCFKLFWGPTKVFQCVLSSSSNCIAFVVSHSVLFFDFLWVFFNPVPVPLRLLLLAHFWVLVWHFCSPRKVEKGGVLGTSQL